MKTGKMTVKTGLKPVVDSKSRILILGSLPGDMSLQQNKYYAYSQNQFWKILSCIYYESPGEDYESKLAFLGKHGIALWDVLKASERHGSLDSKIKSKSSVINDLEILIREHPKISAIGLNGTKAWKDFKKHWHGHPIFAGGGIYVRCLPSSSSSYAKPLPEKVQAWQEFLGLVT